MKAKVLAMTAQKTQSGGLGDFFKRWKNGDLLERHRRNKVADFWERLHSLIDPEGKHDILPDTDYVKSLRTHAKSYISQRITPEQFDRMVKTALEDNQPVSQAERVAAIDVMRRPALLLNKMPTRDTPGAPGCWLGGLPNLPPELEWPWCRQQGKDVVPMHFVAQIDLSQIPRDPSFPEMPETGTLFFFMTKAAHHVLDFPDSLCRVFYIAGDVSQFPLREMPEMPDFSLFQEPDLWAQFYQYVTKGPLSRWNIDFLAFDDIHVPANGEKRFWRARIEALCEVQDHLRDILAARFKGVTINEDGDGAGGRLHQLFGCQSGGNAGGETLLLAVKTDGDILFEDQYIEGLQIHFDSMDARKAFDLDKLRLEAESS